MEFHAVLLKTCETVPRHRYATAQAMHTDLTLLKKGKSVRRLHWVERRLRLFKGIGLAAAILAILAVGATLYQIDVNRRTNRLTSDLANSLYAADVNFAAQDWYSGNLEAARALLAKHGPHSASKHVIGFEWRLLWTLCHRTDEAFAFRGFSGQVRSVASSPDGRTVASAGEDGTVRILNVQSGSEVVLPKHHSGKVHSLAFSEDGRFLATGGSDRHVRLVDTKDWHNFQTLGPLESEINHLAFSPDSRLLAAGAGRSIVLWDLPSTKRCTIDDEQEVYGFAFSPDGRVLASHGGLSTLVRFWDPVTGERLGPMEAHTSIILGVALSANGQLMATSGHDNRVRLWSRDAKGQGWNFRATFLHEALVGALAFSPDSQLLANSREEVECQTVTFT